MSGSFLGRIAVVFLLAGMAGCSDHPVGISADGALLENGGSYGSGGRSTADSTSTTSGVTAADSDAPERNGGSYGSGG